MKNCNCDKWKKYIGKWEYFDGPNYDSSKSPVPMYFGVQIDFCPWCGNRLITDKGVNFKL